MRSLLFGLTFTMAAGLATPTQAADPVRVEGSLQMVPSDVAFYASTLRIGEQFDAFLGSKAYAKLRSLPATKFALEHVKQEAANPGNPLAQVMQFFEMPDNKELAEVLHDLGRNEFFLYSGEDTTKFISLVNSANRAAQFAPFNMLINRNFAANPQAMQLEAALKSMKENQQNMVIPEFVFGFRSTKKAVLQNQFNRLEPIAKMVVQQAPPPLQKGLKRQKVGDADMLSFSVDGSMVPWNEIPFDQLGVDKDDYKEVFDKLQKMTVTLTLAVKGDYFIICLAGDSSPITKFGQGTALATRREFAPLAKYADRKIVSLSYSSQKMAETLGTSPKDVTGMFTGARELLKNTPLSDGLKKKIGDDLEAIGKESATNVPKPAATMGFSFLTNRGAEGYDFVYNDAPVATKPLTIVDHVGSSPLMVVAERGEDATPAYRWVAKWARTFYAHAEAVVKELAEDGQVEQFNEVAKKVIPYLKRFDEITGNQLLPALADGQSALVIDGKWTSKAWHAELDQKGMDLPMLELGLCAGVSDAELLVKAFKGYRALVNDIFNELRPLGAEIPEAGWPPPKTQMAGSATLYYWPVPELGQEKAVMPNIGVSKTLLTFCLSAKHAERLHTKGNLSNDLKQFAGDRPVSSVSFVDFAGIVNTARPWVEKFALPEALKEMPEGQAPPGLGKADIPPQVSAVFDVLQCLKGYRSVTYRDGDATVTRYETRIEDLK